ncbi:MAG: ArnT family glycosyltransferase [Planctomycetota bacterium]
MTTTTAPTPAAADDASPAAHRPPHSLWWLLLACAAIAAGVFLFAVTQRLFYPHEVEWMEGALADHAARVADGLPLYAPPSAEHVPFLYAPLLFWLGALGIHLGLDGIVALRLIATLSSIASAMLIGHWVRRDSGRVLPGLVATGMFLAGYGWLAWWFDLARNDSLFVMLCLAASYQLRYGTSKRWLWAGLLATTALLAKQSTLMWLPAVGLGALCLNWRVGIYFGLTSACTMAIAIGAMHLTSDGWSTFYLFEMPRHHGWVGQMKLGFWTIDMVTLLPLLVLALLGFAIRVRKDARSALFLAMFGCGGLLASWLSRMHVGGFDNVLMYGFSAICILGPIAVARMPRGRLQIAGMLLLAGQFVFLAYRAAERDPAKTLFAPESYTMAHEELRTYVEAQQGPVWIPAHGHIAYRANKSTGAHGQAMFDLLQVLPKLPNGLFDFSALAAPETRLDYLSERGRGALKTMFDSVHETLRDGRFAAIVIDEIGTGMFPVLFAEGMVGADRRMGTADDPYVRREQPLTSQPGATKPLIGFDVRNPYAFERRQ